MKKETKQIILPPHLRALVEKIKKEEVQTKSDYKIEEITFDDIFNK